MIKLVVSVVIAFAIGVYVGHLPITSLVLDSATAPTSETTNVEAAAVTPTTETKGTVVKTTNLSAGQQKLLSALGIDASQIVITPAMIACAEAKLGAAWLKEIEGGATPTFSEGVSLYACYK
ncbi:MAG: hypothetical protein WA021_02210 [Minisyncoccia bacterium]